MRTTQIVITKLLCLLVFLSGIAIAVMWWRHTVLSTFLHFFLTDVWRVCGLAIGVAIAFISLPALFPLRKPTRKKTISFAGSRGQVAIELDSIEATLGRVVGKMPEVKRVAVTLVPSEDGKRAQVTADVVINKGSGPVGARAIANQISDYLAETAVDILGVEDVTTVDLNVRGIVVHPPKAKLHPEPEATPVEMATPGPVRGDVVFEEGEDDARRQGGSGDGETPADGAAAGPSRKRGLWSRTFGKKDQDEAQETAQPVELTDSSFGALSDTEDKDGESGAIG